MTQLRSPFNRIIYILDEPRSSIKQGALELSLDAPATAPIHGDDFLMDVRIFNPAHHAIISGTVVAVPERLMKPKRTNEQGYPAPYNLWAEYEVTVVPQVGDKIYFHHATVHESRKLDIEGNYYCADYQVCYFVERNGEIIPLDNFILVEPISETEDEIKTKSGIFTKSQVEKKYLQGIIRYYGKPLLCELTKWKDQVKEGVKILFTEDSEYVFNINGKELYLMRYWDISGLIKE